jgi:hypothetical protein
MKTLYIKDADVTLWSEFTDACTEDGQSVSERVAECIRRFMHSRDRDNARRITQVSRVLVLSGKYSQEQADKLAAEMLRE